MPTLTPGVALNGTIANGQDIFFRVNIPALDTRSITLDSLAGVAELLVRAGDIAESDANDAASFGLAQTHAQLLVPGGRAGDYFITIHGRDNAGAGSAFTLEAEGLGFSLVSVDRSVAKNIGDVTFTIHGSQFTDATTFDLHGPSGLAIDASQVVIGDAGTAYATFALGGKPAGSYQIRAHKDAASISLDTAVSVTEGGTAGKLVFDITAPSYIRQTNGRPGVATVHFTNVGDSDLPAQYSSSPPWTAAARATTQSLASWAVLSLRSTPSSFSR